MAYTACFLHHHAAISTPTRSSVPQRLLPSLKTSQLICRAQKQAVQEDGAAAAAAALSRRLALGVLLGAAAVGSKVSPADAAYGESGTL